MESLKKHQRITGTQRKVLVKRVRAEYRSGSTIRNLADQTGRSYGFIHRLLVESGAQLRARGGTPAAKG